MSSTTITGTITAVRWTDGAGRIIAVLDNKISAKGFLPGVGVGSKIEVSGVEKIHPKFGPEITAHDYSFVEPTPNEVAIVESLRFLHQTLGFKKRGEMIFRTYGTRTREIMAENPYQIVEDVPGVGFHTADEIASKLGISDDHPRRIDECIMHCLRVASESEGHVYLGWRALVGRAIDFTASEPHVIEKAVARLALPWRNRLDEEKPPRIVLEGGARSRRCYARNLHQAETGVAKSIERLLLAELPGDIVAANYEVEDLRMDASPWEASSDERAVLTAEQREAVVEAIMSPVSVITGGPGTGKTTIIRALAKLARSKGLTTTLCAPTGRAAKRMSEASGEAAATIHRALGYNPQTGKFTAWRDQPLDSDLVICDEASMVDVSLGHALCQAVKPGGRLVLVGDVDQLPPVGPGSLLRDVISSGVVPVRRLSKIFRQKEGSLIIKGSYSILSRKEPAFAPSLDEGDIFKFTYRYPGRAAQIIVDLAVRRIPEKFKIRREDVQVICPIHKGPLGIDSLNLALQEATQGRTPSDSEGKLLVGDRVVQTKNNYDVGGQGKAVYNGDIGYVSAIEQDGRGRRRTVVDFAGMACRYTEAELDELQLAYAITIHKAQGSEYAATIVIASTDGTPTGFYSRNMLYTAATRGKRLVVVVTPSSGDILRTILLTDEGKRNTMLGERIAAAISDGSVEDHGPTKATGGTQCLHCGGVVGTDCACN